MKCVKDMILASLSSLALFCYAGNWSAAEWCDVSNYTNACGPMRTMLLNPKGVHDNLAVAQIAVMSIAPGAWTRF